MNENMNGPHMAQAFMHNTFWVANQISFTFDVPIGTQNVLEALHLQVLDAFLREHGFFLIPFSSREYPRLNQDALPLMDALVRSSSGPSEQLPPGIYVFPGTPGTEILHIIAFFRFGIIPAQIPLLEDSEGHAQRASLQPVPVLVSLVNSNLTVLNGLSVPITSAAPNWLCGASNGTDPLSFVATGCPLLPPIPVPADAYCANSPGLWPISLPDLPQSLKRLTGDGVTVFVLDTLPKRGDITRAAQAAEEHNLLLLDLENNVKFSYPIMHDLDRPDPSQPVTGKDITGRLIGFRMPDHGLFVAGIIRDLAPDAQVECIRVLNDWCVGPVQMVIDQLYGILQRILADDGDLHKKDVVVNLSLVIASDADALAAGIQAADLKKIREPLFVMVQGLADRDVIFAASAGNEGDQRYQVSPTRPDALYPAAFAYYNDPRLHNPYNIIPVGAVNQDGDATSYSCYPGSGGVATYGGDVPAKDNLLKEGNRITIKDPTALDAVIGVYTALSYPALYYKDPDPTYPIPNAHGWAYWVGTSFAAPIASAVAARTLELNRRTPPPPVPPPAMPIVFPAATDSTLWSNLSSSSSGGAGMAGTSQEGQMIRAVQCRFHKSASCCKS
jgi:hypothetical protein